MVAVKTGDHAEVLVMEIPEILMNAGSVMVLKMMLFILWLMRMSLTQLSTVMMVSNTEFDRDGDNIPNDCEAM